MTVTVLVENRACGPISPAHGLSLHIRTDRQSILFDFGPDGNLLLRNAEAMGVDLEAVDLAILSHGHNDHSGGLEAFLRLGGHAPVYIQKGAFAPHFSRRPGGLRSISPSPRLAEIYPDRIIPVNGTLELGNGLTLFADVPADGPVSSANDTLYEQLADGLIPDRFLHEQDLLIREGDKLVLFGGCAHRGITNILRRAAELGGRAPDGVFSGFHLTNPGLGRDEPEEFIRKVGKLLLEYPCRCFTGHCTGDGPYHILKGMLGERLEYLGCGLSFSL